MNKASSENRPLQGIKSSDLAKKIDEFILWNPVEEGLSLEGTPDDPRFAYVKRKK